MPKPTKSLVEFLAEWIRDEDLRCRVLKDEKKTLRRLGLSPRAVDDLLDLDRQAILGRIREELEKDWGMYPNRVKDIINRTPNRKPVKSSGFLWQEGSAHVRLVDPGRIQRARAQTVKVSGQGWDRGLQVWFEPASGGTRVRGKVLDVECGTDIWQHAKVTVTLPTAGRWLVIAVVPSYGKRKDESPEEVILRVR